MARRKNDVGIFEILVKLPWWLALALGISCYIYLKVSPSPVGVFPATDVVVKIFVQFFQWMCFGAALVSGVTQLARKILFASAKDLDAIRAMSWRDFENLVCEAYRRQGYLVEETGGGGADGGIDLLLHGKDGKIIVQCKQMSQPVSREAHEPETSPCPLCGSTMILRTAKRGAQAGNRFWGCSTYPKCRGILAVD